jgi:hypothetical protein
MRKMSRESSKHWNNGNAGLLWESQKVCDHYENLDIGGRIIIKWILGK